MKPEKTTYRTLLPAIAIAAALITLITLSTCSNPVSEALNSPSFGLVGTWVSSTISPSSSPGICHRLTVNVDGTFRSEDTGGAMVTTGTYTVDSVSVSGNSRTFRVHYVWGGISHNYILCRVTGGTLYESVYTSIIPYPPSISTSDASYLKFTLQ